MSRSTIEGNVLQAAFERILSRYAQARDQEGFGRTNALWSTFETLGADLRANAAIAKSPNLKVKWSAGQGRWATVPWIAVLDKRETDRTSEGVYVIYLFRADLAGVYLTINQGASWALTSGNQREAFVRLRDRAAELRAALGSLPDFDLSGAITLGSPAPLIKAYEASTIAAKYYAKGTVPEDATIQNDLTVALTAYQRLVPTRRVPTRPPRASLS